MTERKLHLPSLALLRSFESAARHQSFTQAAEELHLTQSAISRQVRELEETMGVPLFRRLGRRVVLTDAGRLFAADIAVDLDRLRQTSLRAIAAGDNRTTLRIATLPTFAARWLIPRLPSFEAANPDVEISLATRLEPFDLLTERFDLAIHYGAADWPNAHLTLLCREEMIVVSAPGAFADWPAERWPMLHLESRPNAWADWRTQRGLTQPTLLPGKRFDQFSMVIAAAVAGLGVGLVPDYLVEAELAAGSLVLQDVQRLANKNAYYIARPRGLRSAQGDRFVHWIRVLKKARPS